MKFSLSALGAALALTIAVPAFAAEPATLQQTVEAAVSQNPDVLARWHRFLAAGEEASGARGGYLPSVDASASRARETSDRPDFLKERKFTRNGYGLTLSQMLFDGFATADNVARLDHQQRARFFELLATSEEIAAEVARAYADVQRYRRLLQLAEENLATHDTLFKQIEQRTGAGVSKRVDLEQAAGRLALARSNVITEKANLADVSQRYRRLVGALPADQLAAFPAIDLPSDEQLWQLYFPRNPALRGAFAQVEAGRAAVGVAKSAKYPQLSLRASSNRGTDLDGVIGDHEDQSIELMLSFNIFNGGRDSARVAQSVHEWDAARDFRDKVCRDTRQNLAVALNDVQRLNEQREFLARHEQATARVRDAYRQQFDLGQRSLLDLLDTENELFQSRRALASAEQDLLLTRARVLAPVGQLLPTLGLNGLQKQAPQSDADNEAGIRECGAATTTVNLR